MSSHRRIVGPCKDCGVTRKLHRHHVVPKFQGGTDHPENVAMLCANCHEDRHLVPGMEPWRNGNTTEARAKKSESSKAFWADPANDAKRLARNARISKARIGKHYPALSEAMKRRYAKTP